MPDLSDISVGVGFIFMYQILAAPVAVERGWSVSFVMSSNERLVEYIWIPRITPFHISWLGAHGASPQVSAGLGGILFPQSGGETRRTIWLESVLGKSH